MRRPMGPPCGEGWGGERGWGGYGGGGGERGEPGSRGEPGGGGERGEPGERGWDDGGERGFGGGPPWGRGGFRGEEGGPPWGRRGFGGRSRFRRRFVMRRLFGALDASPAQERAILAEIDQLEQSVRAAGELMRGGKAELAAMFAAAELDEEAIKAATSRLDSASAQVRDAGVASLRAVHALLDEGQRRLLAEMMERKPWWRGGGMYR